MLVDLPSFILFLFVPALKAPVRSFLQAWLPFCPHSSVLRASSPLTRLRYIRRAAQIESPQDQTVVTHQDARNGCQRYVQRQRTQCIADLLFGVHKVNCFFFL